MQSPLIDGGYPRQQKLMLLDVVCLEQQLFISSLIICGKHTKNNKIGWYCSQSFHGFRRANLLYGSHRSKWKKLLLMPQSKPLNLEIYVDKKEYLQIKTSQMLWVRSLITTRACNPSHGRWVSMATQVHVIVVRHVVCFKQQLCIIT